MQREFKIVMLNKKGELVNEYEMFGSLEKANEWGDKQNKAAPGSVVDITLRDVNEEFKYEHY
jgi:hypothetical protein